MSRDFVDESNVKFWLGPVAPSDCGCPTHGPHGLDCPEHPDRIAEAELLFDIIRTDRAARGARGGE